MFPTRLLWLPAFLLAVAPAASAQDDGCNAAHPCPWEVDVGPDGFITDGDVAAEWEWTVGDAVSLNVFNHDDVAHTVTLTSYGVILTVPPLQERSSALVLDRTGDFELQDNPSSDVGLVYVLEEDVVEFEEGAGASTSGGNGAPGLALPLAAFALLAVAALRRRA